MSDCVCASTFFSHTSPSGPLTRLRGDAVFPGTVADCGRAETLLPALALADCARRFVVTVRPRAEAGSESPNAEEIGRAEAGSVPVGAADAGRTVGPSSYPSSTRYLSSVVALRCALISVAAWWSAVVRPLGADSGRTYLPDFRSLSAVGGTGTLCFWPPRPEPALRARICATCFIPPAPEVVVALPCDFHNGLCGFGTESAAALIALE